MHVRSIIAEDMMIERTMKIKKDLCMELVFLFSYEKKT
jgi:hypothetical protein